MSVQEILPAAASKGYKTDEAASTVSGVTGGIAFRAQLLEDMVEMSLNLPEENLEKLRSKLASQSKLYDGVSVRYQNFGIAIQLPGLSSMPASDFLAFLDVSAAQAAKLVGVAYDDKFEKDKEPFAAYLRGIAGALLGALIGVLPWFLCGYFLNWQLWMLGFLVSTLSFYGYRQFYGAHNTTFATVVIVVCTLFAVFASTTAETLLWLQQAVAEFQFPETLVLYLQQGGWKDIITSSLWGLLAAGAGLIVIIRQITLYTHEPWFLRRNKGRRR